MGYRWIAVVVLALAVAALAALPRISTFLAQDACLDGGGAWTEAGACLH